ncbi:Cof-type HAD-IIB family hydrolase [Proteiniphilum sp.]|uniref:Cof-type HAD-IIB family hydrolase n=1 Tax=Proteiniphilum sp. TaxID=1926877 RepID=UPI002B21AFAD|nr:Cof-type HAD-IIB family hydrolase [Proteiniphilum sp.]MEA4918089.1 Cof-type HAD-IIB family hydrolase [Proteiniphilum sp.]
MVKAIFFDIDGTLVSFNTHRIPDSTRKAIEMIRNKGIKVFIATGRHFSVINNLEDIEFDGYITMNGCYCLEGRDKLIFKKSIDQTDVNNFIDYLQQVREFPCLFVEENRLSLNYIDEEMKYLMQLLKQEEMVPENGLDYYRDKELFQLTAFFKDPEEKEIMSHLPNSSSMRWYPTFTDVIAKGVDKGVGIDQFCNYYGFSIDETMAFGDGGNDIEMLQHAGIGIAMGNANDEVKQAADYVTDSVDNDGVFKALRHFGVI